VQGSTDDDAARVIDVVLELGRCDGADAVADRALRALPGLLVATTARLTRRRGDGRREQLVFDVGRADVRVLRDREEIPSLAPAAEASSGAPMAVVHLMTRGPDRSPWQYSVFRSGAFDDGARRRAWLLAPALDRLQRGSPDHGPRPGPLLALSPAERRVFALLAQGHPTAGIAHRLGISPRTVQKHLEHVYAKLGVNDRLSAVLVGRDDAGEDA
jgi:DNA-binding CsgD family transcriptional regulator